METRRNRYENCRTEEELLSAYRQDAKRLHPDRGGDEDAFASASEDYKAWRDELIRISERQRQNAKLMQTIGAIGEILTGFSKGEDVTGAIKKIVPEGSKTTVDILSAILKR